MTKHVISLNKVGLSFPKSMGLFSLLRNLFSGRNKNFTALSEVSLNVKAGEVFGLIGKNCLPRPQHSGSNRMASF